jgi:AcrR family transcriptional regulator
MSRPRSISDAALLDSVLAVMRRAGPGGVTFASVAAETGLAGATLVQRFGSKPAMLQAALLRAWDLLDARTAACDAAAPQTPAGAIAMLVALSSDYGEGDEYAEGLLVLREDLRDPVLRARGVAWGNVLAGALGRRLGGSGRARPDLGQLMAAQWQGAVLWWGFHRRARLTDAVARALGAWCVAAGIVVDAPPGSPPSPAGAGPASAGPASIPWRKRPLGA